MLPGTATTAVVTKSVLEVLKMTKGKSILEVRSTNKSPEATLVLDGEELTVDKKSPILWLIQRYERGYSKLIAAPLEGKTEEYLQS